MVPTLGKEKGLGPTLGKEITTPGKEITTLGKEATSSPGTEIPGDGTGMMAGGKAMATMAQVPAVTNGQKGHCWERVKEAEAAPGKGTAPPGAGLTQPASPRG